MISLKVTPVIPHLCAVVSVIQSTLWIVLKITCSRNPLISPLITIPAFALHIGINCDPYELCSLLDRDCCEGILDICLLSNKLGTRDPERDLSDGRGVPDNLGVLYILLYCVLVLLVVNDLLGDITIDVGISDGVENRDPLICPCDPVRILC